MQGTMADSLWDLSLRDILAATASPSPTPGGGSIAPLTGALGLALVVMALEVTHKKRENEALANAITRGKALLATIADHADRDAAVFQTYMQAFELPKASPEQQTVRATALEAAVLQATHTPLSAAAACLEALHFSESVAALVQRNVVSDLLAGADILLGAFKAALRSVDINLPAVRDQLAKQAFADRANELAMQAEQIYAGIQARSVSA
jgi:formiminotetrahydrofolate cyclodeaminase